MFSLFSIGLTVFLETNCHVFVCRFRLSVEWGEVGCYSPSVRKVCTAESDEVLAYDAF